MKSFIFFEFFLVFIGLPFFVYLNIYPVQKILTLVILTFVCLLVLIIDKNFETKSLIQLNLKSVDFKSMMTKFVLAFGLMTLAVWQFAPESLFVFPRERFFIWLLIMALYPIFSALPQELVYRSFLFHRYRDIFTTKFAIIAASASSFGYLHIIYDNWIALSMTLLGGVLFSLTYYKTRSLLIASFEHALYGCAVQT